MSHPKYQQELEAYNIKFRTGAIVSIVLAAMTILIIGMVIQPKDTTWAIFAFLSPMLYTHTFMLFFFLAERKKECQ